MRKIFVIEDDENIRELVKIALEGCGYQVYAFETAEEALRLMERQKPDLSIFDWMLPGMDGMEAIRKLRGDRNWNGMPIILLTAKDKEYDKVAGLDGGADDYITKPFGVLELTARVRSLLRRAESFRIYKKDEKLVLGSMAMDPSVREVRCGQREVILTYKEYELLLYLVENRTRVVPREELLDVLWGYNEEIETRTLDIHIRTLRQKLGESAGSYIKTARGVGYRFEAPSGGEEMM